MTSLSVLQYNVQQLPFSTCLSYYLTGIHNLRSRLSSEILPEEIGKVNADIIVLNEVFIYSLYDNIRSKLREYGYEYSTEILMHHNWGRLLSGGVVVLSKYPIKQVKEHMFRSCHFPEYFASKGFLYVQIEKDKQLIHLFATHLNSSSGPRFEADRPCREMQMFEMLRFYEKLNIPAKDPVIFAGDMNVNKYYSEEYYSMLRMLNTHEPTYSGLNYTYDELENPLVSCGEGRQWLDYILVKRGHCGISRLNNQSISFKHQGYDLSDHYAVLAEIDFTNDVDDLSQIVKDIIISKTWDD